MYYFSDKFLTGLKSKSENFQNEFFFMLLTGCAKTAATISLFKL